MICSVLLTAVFALSFSFTPQPGQPVPPPTDPNAKSPPVVDSPKIEAANKIDPRMFPDGLSHDFGTVERGTPLRHVFRIVNTTGKQLKISSVRLS
jgi:hypothetical protein